MKAFIVLTSAMVVVCASASRLGGLGGDSAGSSTQFRSDDNNGNYQFGYDESHATGSTSRREEQVNGVRRGSYSLTDADGRQRTVHYYADASGFHATVHTNEPGVDPSKEPADVLINKDGDWARRGATVGPSRAAQVSAYEAAPARTAHSYSDAPARAPVVYRAAANPAQYAHVAEQSYEEQIEEPTPRAFSYSFGAQHAAVGPHASYAPAAVPYGLSPASYAGLTAPVSFGTPAPALFAPVRIGAAPILHQQQLARKY